MSTKQTEWRSVDLSKEELDFSGALFSHLENTQGSFVSLTLKLKNGRTVRIRKNDYSTVVESPVVQMVTHYVVKSKHGLSAVFTDEHEAARAHEEIDGSELSEIQVPKKQDQLPSDLPF